MKDYDLEVQYTPGKGNVVADALSRKSCLRQMTVQPRELTEEFERLNLHEVPQGFLANLEVRPSLNDQIKAAQSHSKGISKIKENVAAGTAACFTIDSDGIVWFGNRLVVPRKPKLKELILKEAHESIYSIHPGSTKMYQDLRKLFWWTRMKREIAKFVSECDTCRRVKAEHQRPAGMLQPLPIPEWKWDVINIDFVTGLPRSPKGNDAIWVLIDRFSKVAHFLPVKTKLNVKQMAELYLARIVSLHGIPKTIYSDRGSVFTSHFWLSFQEALGTHLSFSTAYHPQSSGQVERVNQILEDMLRACVIAFGSNWEKCLPMAEFSYNNSFQASIGMAPFELLYGRPCRTPLNWSETGERNLFGPDLIKEAEEQVRTVREKLKAAQSRQKHYADRRRRALEFEVGDHVYLKVSPKRGTQRFGMKGKLAPRYVGPFKILDRRGPVAYQLELPSSLVDVHDVFHISQLKKCLRVPEEVIHQIDEVQLQPDLSYQEVPIKILDRADRSTRTQTIKFLKVQWKHHSEDEATWEREEILRKEYPSFFQGNLEDEILFRRVGL